MTTSPTGPQSQVKERKLKDRPKSRGRARRRIGALTKHVVLAVLAALSLFPLVLLISTAFKSARDVAINPFGLFTSFSFDSLSRAWTDGNFSEYLLNSILISVPTTILVVVLSTMAGYTFARLPFPGRSILFYTVVLGLLVPFFAYMIPLFFQLQTLHLLDTLPGVIFVLAAGGAGGVSFGTFFMRSFFAELPNELEQAARLDGCSELQIFLKVMVPLVRSGAGALTVFVFIQSWNNFIVPLLFMPSGDFRPLTMGLFNFQGSYGTDVGPLGAGALITIFPVIVLFVLMQKQLTEGFTGAVKG